jgi:GNAT superfamily N-acetyltransferase
MTADIVLLENPVEADYLAIAGPLKAFNDANGGENHRATIGLMLRDVESGKTLGGLWAKISFGWMYVDLLFVPAELRGQDYGTRLMSQAETIARTKMCVGIWVATFGFQAPGFYLKQGYEHFATLDGPPGGTSQYHYRKTLTPSRPAEEPSHG